MVEFFKWLLLLGVMIFGCAKQAAQPPQVHAGDASRITNIPVARIHSASSSLGEAEKQLSKLVKQAGVEGLVISIAGARHSMGGQTAYPNAMVIDMTPLKHMEMLRDGVTLRVGAGARWSDVIPYLHARGRSVAIMQSNHDFTVGGSLSVNCHGWQVGRPPIVSSVKAIRLLRANGQVVRCTREENRQLFRHAIGGYGMFGIILEAELETVPNVVYRFSSNTVSPDDFDTQWKQRVNEDANVQMAYGRLSIGRNYIFNEALLTTLSVVLNEAPGELSREPIVDDQLRRAVFRMGVNNNFGKMMRWRLETKYGESMGERTISRNDVLNEPSSIYAERLGWRTDILHEYFIPRAKMAEFLRLARGPINKHRANLMNVTIRHVLADQDTALPYAREECFSLVMLFNYRTWEAERYAELTRELVEAALSCGGTYYLPYRIDATSEQFRRGYPMIDEVMSFKDREDPRRIFRNQFEEFARKKP